MKTSKILVSMLLLFAMCLSLMSVTALAEGSAAAVGTGGETAEKATLAEAISAAQDGDTVVLLQDVTVEAGITISKDIDLDLNGNTLTFTASGKKDAAILVDGAEVTIKNGTIKAVSEDEDAGYAIGIVAGKGADVTLDNLKLRYACPGGVMLSTVKSEDSSGLLTVYEGEYTQDPSAYLPKGYTAEKDEGEDIFVVSESETVVVVKETTQDPVDSETDPASEEKGETVNDPASEEKGETETDPASEEKGETETDPASEEKGETEADPAPEVAGTVTNADGSAASTIYYYKNSSGMGGDKSYKVSPEPEKVLAYVSDPASAQELKFTFTATDPEDPAKGGTLVISESDNKAALEALAAGPYYLEFQFKDATSAKLDLYIILNLSFDTTKHVKGSGTPIVVTLTDQPETVLISDNAQLGSAKALTAGTDYTVSGSTITLTAAYLDTLADADKAVTKYLGFAINYRGSNLAAPYAITILPPPSIDPDTVTWKRGGEKSFTVKPDVQGVTIDGTAVDSKNYTASGNSLSVKPAAIASLSYGEHTLTVETGSGPVSAKITIEPSLGYSSNTGNQHTKGGSKTLIFIASDPVKTVKVNGTEISSEHYTLSEDKKNITLKASYLNTLKADTTYTITATVSAGGKDADVSSSFKILSGGAGGSAGTAPQTGDSDPTLWVALLLISGCAAAALLPRLKRE